MLLDKEIYKMKIDKVKLNLLQGKIRKPPFNIILPLEIPHRKTNMRTLGDDSRNTA